MSDPTELEIKMAEKSVLQQREHEDPLDDWEIIRCRIIQAALSGVDIAKHEVKLMSCKDTLEVEVYCVALMAKQFGELGKFYARDFHTVNDREVTIETCKTCKFSEQFYDEEPNYICLRFPPNIRIDGSSSDEITYPCVFSKSWCGEFKKRD